MNIESAIMAGNVVLLVIVAVFVVAGLTVSLIAITLTSIKEAGGRTPEWPVSWPEPPLTVPRQRVGVFSGRASLPSQVTLPPGREGEPVRRVSLPQRIEIPRQRIAPPRRAGLPSRRVSPRS
ncbi:hypothetical protein GCM10022252_58800 [Streptosporangium oxazolinicum]|uniref:Uncharacterized protein n=1 Tax=Streptosporangium oxazolinicum TaxID=909287 RepID=A0ABP8BAZ2_9ACTN